MTYMQKRSMEWIMSLKYDQYFDDDVDDKMLIKHEKLYYSSV
jgi:hypothetical protein